MKNKKIIPLIVFALLIVGACKKERNATPEPAKVNTVPEFFSENTVDKYGQTSPVYTLIANNSSKISSPQDLDFNPTRQNELWIINKGIEAIGGSTVMITQPGTPGQQYDYRQDGNAWHFMSLPSAISFSNNGNWATSPNVLDANHNGGTYTGPSLWSGNLTIYAKPSGGNGSHLDMLHGSPFAMGIANEKDNIYWVFDGYNKYICRYNFNGDHGPGKDDHSNGTIHRYTEVVVKRNPTVPSHLAFDNDKRWLYIVDGGNKQILRIDITTGNKTADLPLKNEPLAEHWKIEGVNSEIVVNEGLKQPCGIEINGNRLFVTDYETGDIICYDIATKKELARINTGKPGIMGIKLGPDNKLWFVNASSSEIFRVDPN